MYSKRSVHNSKRCSDLHHSKISIESIELTLCTGNHLTVLYKCIQIFYNIEITNSWSMQNNRYFQFINVISKAVDNNKLRISIGFKSYGNFYT